MSEWRSYIRPTDLGWVILFSTLALFGPERNFAMETTLIALAAFQLLSKLEGIIPALEPAHAIAKVMDLAPKRPKDHLMVVNLSGRGDKDIPQVGDILKGKKS